MRWKGEKTVKFIASRLHDYRNRTEKKPDSIDINNGDEFNVVIDFYHDKLFHILFLNAFILGWVVKKEGHLKLRENIR